MARITVEDCLNNVENRFELVLVAAKRARDISRKGLEPLVPVNNDKPSVIALREIAAGLVDARVLDDIQPEASPSSDNIESANSEYNTQQPFIPKVSLSSHGIKEMPNKLPEVLLKQDSNVALSSKIIPVRLKDFSAENEKANKPNIPNADQTNSIDSDNLSTEDTIENNTDDTKDNNQS